jgi:flagellar assembly protein FliH
MISPFDLAEPQVKVNMAQVEPLEFVSLDEPELQTTDALQAELEAAWVKRVALLEDRLEEAKRGAQLVLDAQRRESEAERIEAAESAEQAIAETRRQVTETIEKFAAERERYFAEVEREVVQLALAIAERVLHREAAMDTVLLRSAVRVALERVAGEGPVTLRVGAGGVAAWRGVLESEQMVGAVDVVEDERLSNGDAVLETAVGRVDLGVGEQLKEIERGFFDLLAARPAR